MAHLTKFTYANVSGLSNHIERKTSTHKNQDIDISRSHLNYSLLSDDSNMNERLRARLSEVYALKRKDVNVIGSWVVTRPETLAKAPEGDLKLFFNKVHVFLKNRYGGLENIVSSEVHMDESTPHLHFAFVPVVFDEKKQRLKVSAKEVLNKQDLKSFHTDLDKYLKIEIPNIYEAGIINGQTLGLDSVEQIKLHDKIIKNAKNEAHSILLDAKKDKLLSLTTDNYYKNLKKTIQSAKPIKKTSFLGSDKVILSQQEWQKVEELLKESYAREELYKSFNQEFSKLQKTNFYETYERLKSDGIEKSLTIKKLQEENQVLREDVKYFENKAYIGDLTEKLYEAIKPLIVKHHEFLFRLADKVHVASEPLSNFCKGFISKSLEQKKLVEVFDFSVDCWNGDYDLIQDKNGLSNGLEDSLVKQSKNYNDFEI